MTNKHVFFTTTPSSDIDVLRNDAIKNEFKLRKINTILNKNKEDEAMRYKNWQLFFRQMAYLLWLIPARKIASKRRLRSKRLFDSKIYTSSHLFFKEASVKQPEKTHIKLPLSKIMTNEIIENDIR